MVWSLVGPILEKAIPYMSGKFTLDDVRQDLLLQNTQLWVGGYDKITSAMVTQIVDTPQLRTCLQLVAAGEDVDEWLPHQELIQNWARGEGCQLLEIMGRHGWLRKLKPYGYEYSYTVMKTDLRED